MKTPLREGWLGTSTFCLLCLFLLDGVESGSSLGKGNLDLQASGRSHLRVTSQKSRGPWQGGKLPFSVLSISEKGLI